MVKINRNENRPKIILKFAYCDRCGEDCKNMHFDIESTFSFSNNKEIIETICYNCFEKHYKKRMMENKEKEMEAKMKDYSEQKALKKGR